MPRHATLQTEEIGRSARQIAAATSWLGASICGFVNACGGPAEAAAIAPCMKLDRFIQFETIDGEIVASIRGHFGMRRASEVSR
jgi:hypothetical protein